MEWGKKGKEGKKKKSKKEGEGERMDVVGEERKR